MLPDGLSAQFNLLAFYAKGVFGYLLFGVMLGPSLLAFALQFPRPKDVILRHPWLGVVPFGLGLLVGAALLSGQAPTFGWLATVGMLIASLVSFLHAVRTQRDDIGVPVDERSSNTKCPERPQRDLETEAPSRCGSGDGMVVELLFQHIP